MIRESGLPHHKISVVSPAFTGVVSAAFRRVPCYPTESGTGVEVIWLCEKRPAFASGDSYTITDTPTRRF